MVIRGEDEEQLEELTKRCRRDESRDGGKKRRKRKRQFFFPSTFYTSCLMKKRVDVKKKSIAKMELEEMANIGEINQKIFLKIRSAKMDRKGKPQILKREWKVERQ